MATAFELEQQRKAAKEKKWKQAGAAAGAVSQVGVSLVKGGATPADVLAGVIEFGAAAGVAAWQYFTGKKRAKKQKRITAAQQVAMNSITSILDTLRQTGIQVIQQHGIDPTTPEFEQALRDNLYPVIGYMGNCNLNAWVPKTKPGPNRPTWFKIVNDGRSFINVSVQHPPPNVGAIWYVECRNMRDDWAIAYQEFLVSQGRQAELEEFQASYKKGVKVMRIVFGIAFAILGILLIRYSLQIKKIEIKKKGRAK